MPMHRLHALLSTLSLVLGACTSATSPADPDDTSDGASDESTASDTDVDTSHGDPSAADSSSTTTLPEDMDVDSSSSGDELECPPLPAGSPPPLVVQDQPLVPIDALAVSAALRFDAAADTASGAATLTFALGPEGGMPIFDLRQTITGVVLDGVDLGHERAPFFQPSDDPEARMRAVTEILEPCSEHTLELTYDIERPDAGNAEPPIYDHMGVIWSSRHSDLWPGRYAENWMPMNRPHDELEIAVEIEVVDAPGPHMVAANGEVSTISDSKWRIEFPADFTALSPMLVLAPESLVELVSSPVDLPDGDQVTIDVVRLTSYGELAEDLVAAAGEALIATNLELGDYPHGNRFLVYSSGLEGGMEYEGATSATIGAIHHEVFHSWIGRGIRPLNHRDGWLDEAWTTFSIDLAFTAEPLAADAPPLALAPADPWTRSTTYPGAYDTGPRVLATLAADIGVDELRGLLRELYQLQADEFVTTEQLESFLVCATEGETVHASFARFVHGSAEPAGPADRSRCP